MSQAPAQIHPHRLVLSAAELELLRRTAEVTLPPGFNVGNEEDSDEEARAATDSGLADAAAALVARGVIGAGSVGDQKFGAVHPSVLANLSVLSQPEVLLQTRASVGDTQVQSAHAVAGPLGASLVRLDYPAVEMSLFQSIGLGPELVRVVPEVSGENVQEGLPDGLVHLDALTQIGLALRSGGEHLVALTARQLDLGADEVALVRALDERTEGVLHCLVLGPPSQPGEALPAGQVVWFATSHGWVGASPEPGPGGERLVRLVPVERQDLGTWVAPFVDGVLG